MIATISTHNGSSVAREHNLRNPKVVDKEKHIRKDGIHETWVDVPPRKAYKDIFGGAVDRFNEKQTRRGRRITDYYNHVLEDKQKHAVYEMIVGVYPKPDWMIGITPTSDDLKGILREYVDGWAERNPQLRVIGAYYHADEQGDEPHIHIDYVPVATGCKRGPDTQNALVAALRQQGYATKNMHDTAQIQWERAENQALEGICERHGLHIDHPQAGKGVIHMETDAYKAAKKAEEEAIKKRKSAEQAAREANRQLEQLRRDVADEGKKEQEAKENTRNAEADMRNAEAKVKELESKIEKLDGEIASKEATKGKLERDNAMLDAVAEMKAVSMIENDIPAMKQAIADAEAELARQYRPRSRGR